MSKSEKKNSGEPRLIRATKTQTAFFKQYCQEEMDKLGMVGLTAGRLRAELNVRLSYYPSRIATILKERGMRDVPSPLPDNWVNQSKLAKAVLFQPGQMHRLLEEAMGKSPWTLYECRQDGVRKRAKYIRKAATPQAGSPQLPFQEPPVAQSPPELPPETPPETPVPVPVPVPPPAPVAAASLVAVADKARPERTTILLADDADVVLLLQEVWRLLLVVSQVAAASTLGQNPVVLQAMQQSAGECANRLKARGITMEPLPHLVLNPAAGNLTPPPPAAVVPTADAVQYDPRGIIGLGSGRGPTT